LFRLSAVLRQKGLQRVSIAYAGSADLSWFSLPPFQKLTPHQQTTGWIAIGLLPLKIGGTSHIPPDSFYWLEAYRPVCLVGRSIRLYYVPESGGGKTEDRLVKSQARDSQ
jgi:hypothetical protein